LTKEKTMTERLFFIDEPDGDGGGGGDGGFGGGGDGGDGGWGGDIGEITFPDDEGEVIDAEEVKFTDEEGEEFDGKELFEKIKAAKSKCAGLAREATANADLLKGAGTGAAAFSKYLDPFVAAYTVLNGYAQNLFADMANKCAADPPQSDYHYISLFASSRTKLSVDARTTEEYQLQIYATMTVNAAHALEAFLTTVERLLGAISAALNGDRRAGSYAKEQIIALAKNSSSCSVLFSQLDDATTQIHSLIYNFALNMRVINKIDTGILADRVLKDWRTVKPEDLAAIGVTTNDLSVIGPSVIKLAGTIRAADSVKIGMAPILKKEKTPLFSDGASAFSNITKACGKLVHIS
jgi:hypothetical protein